MIQTHGDLFIQNPIFIGNIKNSILIGNIKSPILIGNIKAQFLLATSKPNFHWHYFIKKKKAQANYLALFYQKPKVINT